MSETGLCLFYPLSFQIGSPSKSSNSYIISCEHSTIFLLSRKYNQSQPLCLEFSQFKHSHSVLENQRHAETDESKRMDYIFTCCVLCRSIGTTRSGGTGPGAGSSLPHTT